MIFFEDSDRIFENENALIKNGGIGNVGAGSTIFNKSNQ